MLAKAARRLIPFLALLYFVSFLDRVNVGFAALTMNRDIGLSASAYGFGAGVFFIGYFLFEVPSNLILRRVGARRWIARIMISWGIVSSLTAFVDGPTGFWLVRFLLGIAEAGFFPGIVFYLTGWFPADLRGRALAGFLIAVPISSALGAPLSTALMQLNLFELAGWRSMFLLEGLPAVVLGCAVLAWLPDGPQDARFLTDAERRTLTELLARDADGTPAVHASLRAGLLSTAVWRYALIYFGLVAGLYGFGFWAPQMIAAPGTLSTVQVGLISMAPFALAALAMHLWGARSDAHPTHRARHVALPAFLGGVGFLASALLAPSPVPTLIAFTAAAIGIYAALPVFWTLPTAMLTGTAAAGGIALINSLGNLGGYVGPFVVGWLRERSGDYASGMLALGGALLLSGLLALRTTASRRAPRD